MSLKVAQTTNEILSKGKSNLLVSQVAVEALSKGVSNLMVSQMAVEVLYKELPAPQSVGGGFYEHAIFIG